MVKAATTIKPATAKIQGVAREPEHRGISFYVLNTNVELRSRAPRLNFRCGISHTTVRDWIDIACSLRAAALSAELHRALSISDAKACGPSKQPPYALDCESLL